MTGTKQARSRPLAPDEPEDVTVARFLLVMDRAAAGDFGPAREAAGAGPRIGFEKTAALAREWAEDHGLARRTKMTTATAENAMRFPCPVLVDVGSGTRHAVATGTRGDGLVMVTFCNDNEMAYSPGRVRKIRTFPAEMDLEERDQLEAILRTATTQNAPEVPPKKAQAKKNERSPLVPLDDLPARLRALMDRPGWTQRRIAEEADANPVTVSGIRKLVGPFRPKKRKQVYARLAALCDAQDRAIPPAVEEKPAAPKPREKMEDVPAANVIAMVPEPVRLTDHSARLVAELREMADQHERKAADLRALADQIIRVLAA